MVDKAKSEREICDILGTYFTNCYWNRLYIESVKQYDENRLKSNEIAYKYVVEIFNRAFCSEPDGEDRYAEIMKNVYEYFTSYSEEVYSYDQFIESIAGIALPHEYENDAKDTRKKHIVVREILRRVVTGFSMFVIKTEIPSVLARNKETPVKWRVKFIDVFKEEVNAFCGLLLASKSGVDINKSAMPNIPREVCERLKEKIKELTEEKQKIVTKYNKCVQLITELKGIITKQDAEIAELKARQYRRPFYRPYATPVTTPAPAQIISATPIPEPIVEAPKDNVEPVDELISFSNDDQMQADEK